MRSILIILPISLLLLASCGKKKAEKYAGLYDCECDFSIQTPGESGLGISYTTTIEVIQDKSKLSIGDWTFRVRDLSSIGRFEEELDNGSEYEIELRDNRINFYKSIPEGESTHRTDCYGDKVL